MRNDKGQFIEGHTKTIDERIKAQESLKKQWKERDDYIADIKDKYPYLYNSWRSIRFTKKGKAAGYCNTWIDFKVFVDDMSTTYIKGKRLIRKDKSDIFCKDNCEWVDNKYLYMTRNSTVRLTHNGETLTLKEWSIKYNLNLGGIRSRYFKHQFDYTPEEIIFGLRRLAAKQIKDYREQNSEQLIKDKASKMLSSYKLKDKKKGYEFNIDRDWFIGNILKGECVYCGDNRNLGCDRVDNNKGHTMSNVVPCCYDCNVARSNNFTFKEMKVIGKAIKMIKELRNNTN